MLQVDSVQQNNLTKFGYDSMEDALQGIVELNYGRSKFLDMVIGAIIKNGGRYMSSRTRYRLTEKQVAFFSEVANKEFRYNRNTEFGLYQYFYNDRVLTNQHTMCVQVRLNSRGASIIIFKLGE